MCDSQQMSVSTDARNENVVIEESPTMMLISKLGSYLLKEKYR